MKKLFNFRKVSVFALLLLVFSACQKDELLNLPINIPLPEAKVKPKDLDITFYALAGGVSLDKFSTDNPEKVLNSATISGLQSGEKILAIDFRPATGQLYGLGSTSRLYVINPETGVARMIGTAPLSPVLSGNIAGFDFNPTVDRIRVVTNTGQNLRLNPETGTVAVVDGTINGLAGAMIAASAYTNNVAGATTTILYNIDLSTQKLFKQLPPNDGTLVEVGPLSLKVEGEGGFDISAADGIALGLFEVNKKSTLFTIDLNTGKAKQITKYDKDLMYTGIAIPTQAVAYAVDAMNHLLIFNPENTASVVSKPITGINSGDMIAGIDLRPLNGQLFALGTSGTIYTLNASSGAAAVNGTLSTPLQGTHFGFDFNPTVDRIRIISNTGQNFRYNPNDGALIVDGALNPGTPMVTASAYTNNFAGTTSTMLFNIDSDTDKLYLQSPPNDGRLVEVGALGVNADAANGFDISGTKGVAYALLTSGNSTRLYTINTSTGAATAVGNFSSPVQGFTVGLGF
jgi:hypothetical protein